MAVLAVLASPECVPSRGPAFRGSGRGLFRGLGRKMGRALASPGINLYNVTSRQGRRDRPAGRRHTPDQHTAMSTTTPNAAPKKVNLRSRMIENTAERQVYAVTDGDLEAQVETIDGTFHIYFPNPSTGTAEVQPGEECPTLAEAQAHLAGWFAAHYARTA